jgi:hypothetical protein
VANTPEFDLSAPHGLASVYRLQLIEDGEEIAQGLVSPLQAEKFGARWIEDRDLACSVFPIHFK